MASIALSQPHHVRQFCVPRVPMFWCAPLALAVHARYPQGPRGQTLPQLEGAIAARLKQGYVRDPDVTIEIDRYRPVFVMGEVGRPGQYAYVPGMTAQNAVAIAGGYTPRGNQRDVDITRKINDRIITGRTPSSVPVLAGDTIYVRERFF